MWYSAIQIKTSASETRHHRRQRTTHEDDGDYSNRGEIILYVVHKKSYFAMTQCAKVFAIVHMSRVSPSNPQHHPNKYRICQDTEDGVRGQHQ